MPIFSNVSPYFIEFQETLKAVIEKIGNQEGKKYVLKRKNVSKPYERGIYYAKRIGVIYSILDFFSTGIVSPFAISGFQDGSNGPFHIEGRVKSKDYEILVNSLQGLIKKLNVKQEREKKPCLSLNLEKLIRK